MVFDQDRTFDVDHGIELGDMGTKIYSGNGTPVGTQAPIRSYYFDNLTGLMWFKYGVPAAEWRAVRSEYGRDSSSLFTSIKGGQSFNGNQYKLLTIAEIYGADADMPGPTVSTWHTLVENIGAGSIDVRLFDVDNNSELALINVTGSGIQHIDTAFIPSAGNELTVEIQGRKNGNSTGVIYWSSVDVKRSVL